MDEKWKEVREKMTNDFCFSIKHDISVYTPKNISTLMKNSAKRMK